REVRTLVAAPYSIDGVAFSPDGKTLASANGQLWEGRTDEVKLWDVASSQEVQALKGNIDEITKLDDPIDLGFPPSAGGGLPPVALGPLFQGDQRPSRGPRAPLPAFWMSWAFNFELTEL